MTTRRTTLRHQFHEAIPRDIGDGVLYISIPYRTAIHRCCCGCGSKVVTPLSPDDWKLTFDGRSISLYPSIGNWSFPCQSHYWIKESRVTWDVQWSRSRIEAARAESQRAHSRLDADTAGLEQPTRGFWGRLLKRLKRG